MNDLSLFEVTFISSVAVSAVGYFSGWSLGYTTLICFLTNIVIGSLYEDA